MPELPEVDTIRLGLSKKIIGLKIKTVKLLTPTSFLGDSSKIVNKKIQQVWRRAKVLGINLENGWTVLFHLKMTGQLILIGKSKFMGGHPTLDMDSELPNKSTRVVFYLSDKSTLYFNDQRRFGWVKVVETELVSNQSLIKSLGPEPLEKNFTWQVLKQNLIRHKSQPVKVAILDQTVVSGIGNIYASECCFNAKIDPRKKVKDLTDSEFRSLHRGIQKALQDGIKHGGSSMTHFFNEEGKRGYFLDYAFVYWREGEKCRVCGQIIQKTQLAGRGTYFCLKCQK